MMAECLTTPKSCCYTRLWCIINRNTCFWLFVLLTLIFH